MIQSQEFEIENTHKPKIFITTSGISEKEKCLIRKILPSHIVLEDELTTLTTYLISYKSIISDKFIQAMAWNIKYIKVDWLYDTGSNPNKYILKPLEGIEFSSNDITNDIFINFLSLQGAVYNENLTISTGFFISNVNEGEKIDFCKKHDIPIIRSEEIFKNKYKLIQRPFKIKAYKIDCDKIFNDKCFYIDPELNLSLFNLLKRFILEFGGSRLSVIDRNVNYILSNNIKNFLNTKCKILHYQYIFDCIDHKAELFPNSYIINKGIKSNILNNTICCIEKSIKKDSLQIINKLKALGCYIKEDDNLSCTHMIIKDKNEYKSVGLKPYKMVTVDWIDQCLYTLKHVREDKYLVKESNLSLFALTNNKTNIKRIKTAATRQKIFQFTGLPSFLKNKAIEMLEKFNIKYIISERYEECTHLIMGNVSTSEKFLCALANGAWILTPEFIENFDNSIHFDYEQYEWKSDENTDDKDKKIINSIKKWRERNIKTGYPAFYKWKVKLYATEAKRQNFTRVIENGGGQVVTNETFTHCFIAKDYKDAVKEKKAYSTDYIFAYLFK
ncbi:BRCT domain-containing protein [Vairimorpha necatrix]|uniref:BRCT domain-containing protein n=1 Tax=Vairimorpha necatrix TaxID=6039 RepID=A0AAX4JGK7_9MICR